MLYRAKSTIEGKSKHVFKVSHLKINELLFVVVEEVMQSKMLPVTITLSKRKWSFYNHGAIYCLAHLIKRETFVDIYCLNDPEYLSSRYLSLMVVRTAGDFFEQLRSKNWFVSILSNKGKFILNYFNYVGTYIKRLSIFYSNAFANITRRRIGRFKTLQKYDIIAC